MTSHLLLREHDSARRRSRRTGSSRREGRLRRTPRPVARPRDSRPVRRNSFRRGSTSDLDLHSVSSVLPRSPRSSGSPRGPSSGRGRLRSSGARCARRPRPQREPVDVQPPISTAVAPSASALKRRRRRARRCRARSGSAATASATRGRNRGAIAPSTWRPPWFETHDPVHSVLDGEPGIVGMEEPLEQDRQLRQPAQTAGRPRSATARVDRQELATAADRQPRAEVRRHGPGRRSHLEIDAGRHQRRRRAGAAPASGSCEDGVARVLRDTLAERERGDTPRSRSRQRRPSIVVSSVTTIASQPLASARRRSWRRARRRCFQSSWNQRGESPIAAAHSSIGRDAWLEKIIGTPSPAAARATATSASRWCASSRTPIGASRNGDGSLPADERDARVAAGTSAACAGRSGDARTRPGSPRSCSRGRRRPRRTRTPPATSSARRRLELRRSRPEPRPSARAPPQGRRPIWRRRPKSGSPRRRRAHRPMVRALRSVKMR